MLAIPQLELRNGFCVRPSVPFGTADSTGPEALGDPIDVARAWANAGFRRIHIVDADAISGIGTNAGLVEDIIRDGAIDVQAHDAAASGDHVERLVFAGASHVVVGARGLEEPDWLETTANAYPGTLIVATDVRERRVVVRGWVRSLPLDILDVVADLSGLPLGGLLVSSAGASGHRTNADLSLLEDVADACTFPLIAMGGVADVSDLRALEHRGVSAVVLGEPLYRGHLDARSIAIEFAEGL